MLKEKIIYGSGSQLYCLWANIAAEVDIGTLTVYHNQILGVGSMLKEKIIY